MKIRLLFKGEQAVLLPVQYKHIIQAAFLQWLQDQEVTSFIHERGYHAGKRTYKLYAVSDILTRGIKDQKSGKLLFREGIELMISSFTPHLDEAIRAAVREEHFFVLGEQALFLVDFEEIEEKYGDCTVRTLSPVTIHSTFELPGGSKKTYYYAPTEKEFSMQLRDNIIRKYISIYGAEPDDDDLEIIPLNVQKMKKVVINYKSTVIVGWTGSFAIHGNPELIRIALLCGFGARNGMGMGAVIQKPIIR